MTLSPIWSGAMPHAPGLWERAVLTWHAYSGDFEAARSFLLQFDPTVSVVGVHRPQVWPPSWLVARVGATAEVCIAGTDHLTEILGHLAGVVAPEERAPGGIVNASWASYWRDMRAAVWAAVDEGGPPERVILSGHSYGGGVAGIGAFDAAARYGVESTGLYTLGCPRYRGGPIDGPHPQHTVRASSVDDPVPRLPPQLASIWPAAVGGALAFRRSLLTRWFHFGYYVQPTPSAGLVFRGEGVEEPGTVFAASWSASNTAHTIGEYTSRLLASGLVTPPTARAYALGTQAAAQGMAPPAAVPLDKAIGLDVGAANRVYYGTTVGPIAADNLAAWEATAIVAGPAALVPPANIGDFLGVPAMSTPSGLTRVTMAINNGLYGHQESHVIAKDVNSQDATDAARRLVYQRIQLLGNQSPVGTANAKKRGSPQVQFAILTDAINPKLGRVLDLEDEGYFGPRTTPALPADVFSSALTVRMQGKSADPANAVRTTTLQIIGQPDDAIINAKPQLSIVMSGGTLAQLIRQYVIYLRNGSADQWGFVGIKQVGEPKKGVDLVIRVDPYWVLTVPAHGYVTGDRVRVTSMGTVFNGVWVVVKLSADTFGLRKGPVSGHTVPPVGFVQRVGRLGGIRALEFYPYFGAVEAAPGIIQVKYAKHNPGREFLGVSFQRRVRRER